MAHRDLVVVGTSMGGVEALSRLAAQLPAGFPAAVVVVMHVAPDAPSVLARILDRAGPLPALPATDGAPLLEGRIYVAPPDHHLLVGPGRLHLARGPRVNRSRPSVDVLFRSAAAAYGARVVGVVLTGLLRDGAAGLHDVKRRGGLAVVQDPADALYPGMPASALRAVAADHVVALAGLGRLLDRLVRAPLSAGPAPPARPLVRGGPAHGETRWARLAAGHTQARSAGARDGPAESGLGSAPPATAPDARPAETDGAERPAR